MLQKVIFLWFIGVWFAIVWWFMIQICEQFCTATARQPGQKTPGKYHLKVRKDDVGNDYYPIAADISGSLKGKQRNTIWHFLEIIHKMCSHYGVSVFVKWYGCFPGCNYESHLVFTSVTTKSPWVSTYQVTMLLSIIIQSHSCFKWL